MVHGLPPAGRGARRGARRLRRVGLALGVVATSVVLAGCGSGDVVPRAASAGHIPLPSPSPTPPPPSPSPEPGPVVGVVEVRTLDASEPGLLGFDDDAPPDAQRATAIAHGIADALDAHLTAVQRGAEELAGLAAVWVTADESSLATLTTTLTSPELPVERVLHDVVVHWESAPTVAVVTTTVERVDDSTVVVDLVFDVTSELPRLQLVSAGTSPTGGAT